MVDESEAASIELMSRQFDAFRGTGTRGSLSHCESKLFQLSIRSFPAMLLLGKIRIFLLPAFFFPQQMYNLSCFARKAEIEPFECT